MLCSYLGAMTAALDAGAQGRDHRLAALQQVRTLQEEGI